MERMTMEVVWILKNEEIRVILTENSFKNTIDNLLEAKNDAFLRINDPRFDGGSALFMRKDEIRGWRCPGSAIEKYQKARMSVEMPPAVSEVEKNEGE